jgi:hypothetical protein
MMKRVAVIVLTWERPHLLHKTLFSLSKQTNKSFDVYISNSNIKNKRFVDKTSLVYKNKLNIKTEHVSNEYFCFRRFFLAKKLYEEGTEIIVFLDDDITIPDDYIEKCLAQYEPQSYKSWWAWNFNGKPYKYVKDRTRIQDPTVKVDYCGTGVSIIDASIFADKGLFDCPKEAYEMDDLWISYFTSHVRKWRLSYLDIDGVKLGGDDSVALFRKIMQDKTSPRYKKLDFLEKLRSFGWKV